MIFQATTDGQKIVTRTPNIERYLNDIRPYKPLTPEEEQEAFKAYSQEKDPQKKEKILADIMMANQRLIYKTAKQLTTDSELIMDLVAEGNIGMMEALEKYDPSRGYKFITYMIWYIRRNMNTYLYSTAQHVQADYEKRIGTVISRERNLFFVMNGRYPTEDELIDLLESNHKMPFTIKRHMLYDLGYVSTNEMSDAEVSHSSIREKTYKDSNDFNERTQSDNTYEGEIENDHTRAIVLAAMNILKPREKSVIKMFYGIDSVEKSVFKIASELQVTETRVRQIINESLRKLRKHMEQDQRISA